MSKVLREPDQKDKNFFWSILFHNFPEQSLGFSIILSFFFFINSSMSYLRSAVAFIMWKNGTIVEYKVIPGRLGAGRHRETSRTQV